MIHSNWNKGFAITVNHGPNPSCLLQVDKFFVPDDSNCVFLADLSKRMAKPDCTKQEERCCSE